MSMGRYLCQLCWSIVHYGVRHPCFFYKDEDEVYTVPPPMESEEMEGNHEKTQDTHSGNSNQNNLNICTAAKTNHDEVCNERNSSVIENYERNSLVPASGTKRRRCSMFPSFRGITSTNTDSECASNTCIERDDSKDGEKKSTGQRKRKRASAEATQAVDSSSIGMANCSSAMGSLAHGEAGNVAGPSGVRTQSLGSEKERAFVCDVCGRDFARIYHLNRHRRTHTGEKQFKCDNCGERFARKDSLVVHRRTHTGERRFACDKCTKRFTQKCSLELHLRTHTGEKPFPCDNCGERFARKDSLVVHCRTHTGERPFACDKCTKRFTQKYSLELHLRTHTGEKLFPCDNCGERFARKDSLVVHLRTHTGEKPYKCKWCGRDFSDPSHHRRHLKQIHGEE